MIDFDAIPCDRLPALLRASPKAELHIHIDGSLEPELIFALAQRNGVALPYASVQALRAAYAFTDLQSFLDIYYAGASVLLKEDDFFEMAMAYFRRAAADHIVHAELFFDPQTHTERGGGIETVIHGLARACRAAQAEFGISALLILCFLRHLSEDAALVARLAAQRVPLTVCPLSNLKLCVYPTLAVHPLPAMLDAGLCAMLNSDDPAYFGGYLNQNYLATFEALPQLTARHAHQLASNSFEASFASDADKRRWAQALDKVFAAG